MEASKLKRMVVLKNLPSNIIDEAIIVLKSSKKIRKVQKIEQKKNVLNKNDVKKDKDYILREAEMLVNDYISSVDEKEKNELFKDKKMNKRYIIIKKYAVAITLISVIQTFFIVCH